MKWRGRGGAVLLTMLAAAAGAMPAAGAGLPSARVGTVLSAPAGDPSAATVSHQWDRCSRYGQLVAADAPSARWPLEGGAPGALAGQSATATRLDGTSAAVRTRPAAVLDGSRPYTIELWLRPSALDGRYRFPVAQEAVVDGRREGTGIWVTQSGLGFERFAGGVKTGGVRTAAPAAGVWTHVAATFDGQVMRLFVDGRQVGSRTAPAPLRAATVPLVIGARDDAQSGLFAGDLDEVALYDHALARAHIAAHAEAGREAPCHPVAGATGATYTAAAADVGSTIRARTTSREAAGRVIATATAETPDPVADASGARVTVALDTPSGPGAAGTVQVTATPGGLPGDRLEFLVDGVPRYAKPAEPPYQYTWYTRAEANGRHTVAVRLTGPGGAATASRTVTVSNRTEYPAPLAFGKESMYAEFNEGDEAVARNLLDDVWPARGFALPHLGWPLTWTEDPYDDAYWRFYHYSLRPESSLLYMWRTTHDRAYLDKLVAILRSYAAYDAVRPASTLTFDNNHAAAYRTMTLVNFYAKLAADDELPADLAAGLYASLERLGAFLDDPRHFEGGHNHGFNEAAALLLLADNFPSMRGAAAWRQTAIDRLNGMLTATLDADGVEVENSPFYHVYVLGLVYQIAEWAKRYEPAIADAYARAERQGLRYAAYVTQPSGYLPMLGATATTFLPSQDPTVYGPMADQDPEFRFAYTRGRAGTPPPDGAYLFGASGLFLLRSPLGTASNLPNQTFMTFDAGPYRTEHSDLDALGVTMYSSAGTVLPESGLFTYTQQPERAYFHGTRAHNTVVVDGADQAAGAATPGPSGGAGGAAWATGTSGLYPGVTHRRAVVVLRQGLALVVDRLSSAASHAYAQTWHLAPGATVDARGTDVAVADAAGRPTLAIHQADPAGLSLATAKGRTSPTLQGWYSSSYGAKVPAYALEFTRTGPDAQFATLLAADGYAGRPATVTQTPAGGSTRVDVCVDATIGYRVLVPADGSALTVTAGGCV